MLGQFQMRNFASKHESMDKLIGRDKEHAELERCLNSDRSELVRDHMSDKGNEGVTRYRLMCLLRSCSHRAFYLRIQERKYPHTWRIRWKWRRFRLFLHRRFKTCYFRKQVKLCNVASEVIKGFEARLLYADEYKTQQ